MFQQTENGPLQPLSTKSRGSIQAETAGTEIIESDVPEETASNCLLKKDQLPEANCCRFCGLGGKNELEFINLEFISLYQKPFKDAGESLDCSINRYLPLKVCRDDLYYPKVICSPCYDSFEKTVWFFDKISEGQALLAKIINQIEDVKNKVVTIEKELHLQFSDENPILNAKKRRGRPRKDPSKPKIVTPSPVASSEYVERTKRQSRPPARFVAFDLSTKEVDVPLKGNSNLEDETDEFSVFLKSEKGSPDIKAKKQNKESLSKSVEKEETNASIITSIESDFSLSGLTRRDNIMDLVKLNVIMDGDEEIESTVVQISDNEQSQEKTLIRKMPILNRRAQRDSEVQERKENEKSNSESQEKETLEMDNQDHEELELEGSDTSFKLSDLIGRAKKSLRKKRKRRGKSYRGKQFNCADCDRTFSHQSSLVYHRVAVHDQTKRFVCPTCKKGFTHKQLLTNHLYTHYDERFFACEICSSKFKSRASLYTHTKSVHTKRKEFTCEKCGFQFNLKSSLKSHMRLHTGEKPFTCEFCQKRFAQRSNMVEHRRIHTGERPYICPTIDCDKSFTTASQLRNHKLTHSGWKPFLCSTCGKGFANNENFKYHMRRHAGDRPLDCPVCHKQFIEPWSLKKHWRLHTGEKPYECTQCSKVFSDPSNYSKHKKMHVDHSQQNQVDSLFENSDTQNNSKSTASGSEIQEDEDEDISEIPDLDSQMVSDVGQTENDECELVEDETQSLVHILNAENLTTLEGSDHDGQSSVIYVYPGEVPVYTITIADNQQTIEVQADDEMALHRALGSLAGGPITFATVDASEMESQYYDLETVDGTTTVMVPASQLSNLSGNANSTHLRNQNDTDEIVHIEEEQAETESTAS